MSKDLEAQRSAGGQRLLIGTSNPTFEGGVGPGIFAATFRDGRLTEPALVAKATSPSFLAVPAAGHPLYAVVGGDDSGSIAASYRLPDGRITELQEIGRASSGKPGGCHISTTADGTGVFVSNYGGASVASFHGDGSGVLKLASLISFPPDEHGPVADRQDASHVHSALVSPDGGYLLVNDLGLDRIHVFALDPATAKLSFRNDWVSTPGAGPRHLVMHSNKKWIYCICEVGSLIFQLEWNAAKGSLTTLQKVSTLPAGTPEVTGAKRPRACEMAFSKDERFLYAANRIHETFAVFSVDAKTGALTMIQELTNPGREARFITLDPSGKWFLSANQFSGDISVFPVDAVTGKLSERSGSVKLAGPSHLLFV